MSAKSTLHSSLPTITEYENNDLSISSRQRSLSPHDVSRRRNHAVNSLYKTAIKKRCSAGIVSIETFCEDYSSFNHSVKRPVDSSETDLGPELNVTVNHEPQSSRKTTPISHYEHNMNHSVALGVSSGAHLPATQDLRPPLRGRLSNYANKMAAERRSATAASSHHSGKISDNQDEKPQQRKVPKTACLDSSVDSNDLLCDEILSALNDDIFDANFSFDNKWVDSASAATRIDKTPPEISPQSPGTFCERGSCSKTTSHPVSLVSRDHDDNIDTEDVQGGKPRVSDLKATQTRFQVKLDNLRLRSQRTQDISWLPNLGEGHEKAKDVRFWSTSASMTAKMTSESINRDLRHVTRRSFHATTAGEKTLTSVLRRLSSEHSQNRYRIPAPLQGKLNVQPVVGRIKSPKIDVLLSDFLQKTMDENNSDASFRERLSLTLLDGELQSCILRGRDCGKKMWAQFEKLEFE